jgi:hypothetical protein
MTWNDHTHREYAEERHDHDLDYAERHHRHYDLETDDKTAQQAITCLRDEVDELRRQLVDALERIGDLEKQTPQARQLQYEADLAAADLAESGYGSSGYGPPVGAGRHGRDCQCPYCLDDPGDEPEPAVTVVLEFADEDQAGEPEPTELNAPRTVSRTYWPDALCEFVTDDMCGGAAVARVTSRATGDHLWACRPHAEHMLRADPGDAYVSWAKPGEAFGHDGQADESGAAPLTCPHCGNEATGRPGDHCPECSHEMRPTRDGEPEADGPLEPVYDPGREMDDEGGMSEYRYILPEDYQRGQS